MRVLRLLLLVLALQWLLQPAAAQTLDQSEQEDQIKAAKHAANAALARSDFKAAVVALTTLSELQPEDPDVWFRRATANIRQKVYAGAVRDLDRALELDSGHNRALNHRARSLLLLGDCERARTDYQALLVTKPADAKLTESLQRAEQCLVLGKQLTATRTRKAWSQLKSLLDQALGISHASNQLLLERAETLLKLGQFHDVLLDTRSVLQTDKQNLGALEARGRAYYYLKEWEAATTHFRQGLKLSPEHRGLKTAWKQLRAVKRDLDLAQTEIAAGHWSQALEPLRAVSNADPSHRTLRFDAFVQLCEVHTKLRQGKEAVVACTEALTVQPQDFQALLKRVDAHIMAENYQEAVNDANLAAQLDRGSREAQEAMRKAQLALKKGSRKDYYKALGVAPDASQAEIKKAFRKLALQFHPDKVAEDEKEQAEKQFREIGEAYEVLSDEELRRRYDAGEDVEEDAQAQRPQGGHPFAQFFQGGGGGGGGGFPGGFQQGGFHFRFG